MLKAFLAAAALIGGTAAAAPPAKFDLVCSGQVRTAPGGEWAAYQLRMRIDLDAGLYCNAPEMAGCGNLLRLADVRPDRLIFEDRARDDFGRPETHRKSVNRATGEYQEFWNYGYLGIYREVNGTCSRQPFSGFPEARF